MKPKPRKSGPPQQQQQQQSSRQQPQPQPATLLLQQQQQQQLPPQPQASYATQQLVSHALYGASESPGSSSSATSQGLGSAPRSPPFTSSQAARAAATSSSTGGPSTQSAVVPLPAATAGQLYADPRISPRLYNLRDRPASTSSSSSNVPAAGSSVFSAASSSGMQPPLIIGPITLGRPPSGALAARIQAAELSAAGTFDPASWAAAAAEAVQADKQAAAAAAQRAAEEENHRRRLHAQEVAAAALAAGRVSGATQAPTEGTVLESTFRISPTKHQQQQQQQQLLQQAQQQSGAGGSGWLTPTGSSRSTLAAAASSTAAAAAAAAALAAATASYTGRSSPARIATDYVELQRQQQQQQSMLSPRRSPCPHSPQFFGAPSASQGMQPLQQLPLASAASAAAASAAAGSPQAVSSRASSTSWYDMMFDQGGRTSGTSSARSLPIEYMETIQPQLPPIRIVPPQAGPEVQPEGLATTGHRSAMPPAVQPAVLPGHYQDQPGYLEQYRLSRSAIPSDTAMLGISPGQGSVGVSGTVGTPYEQQQQQQYEGQQDPVGPGEMFVPVKAGTGMIGKLLGVQRVSSAGDTPSPAAAAAAAGSEGLPSSSRQIPQRRPLPATAAAAAETKASAAAGDKAAKRRRLLLCILLPLLIALLALAVGLGVGLGTRQQHQQQQAEAPAGGPTPERLTFRVTVDVPTSNSAVSCAKWFGSTQRLETYQAVFVSSYASALDIPPAQFNISSLQCGGNDMTGPSGSAAASRHLMSAAARTVTATATAQVQYMPQPAAALRRHLQQQQLGSQPTPGTTDVVTLFSIPSPADASDRARLIAEIKMNSDKILQDSLGYFFGQPVRVKSAIYEASGTAAATRPQVQRNAEPAVATDEVVPQPPPSPKPQPPVPRMAAVPPPPPRVAVPAPAVPSGVPVVLPLNESRTAVGGAQGLHPNSGLNTKQPGGTQNNPPKPTRSLVPPSSPRPNVLFDTASPCSAAPTVGNSVVDAEGHLWGWEDWQSCAFKGYTSVQTERVNSAWEQAPTCRGQPDSNSSVLDDNGMQWGWQNMQSCAFRAPGWIPKDQQPQPVWQTAPACDFPPNKLNGVSDSSGNLWGWQGQHSCAFKGTYSETSSEGYVRWDAAPTCRGSPTVLNSVADVDGRLWGWQGGKSCAYRPQS